MLKILNIHEWIVSIKHWTLLFIPHLSIYLTYFFYIIIGASIIQEIESNGNETSSSSIKNFQHERERLLIRILEKRENSDLHQYTRYVYRQIRQYEEEIKRQFTIEENPALNFSKSLFVISTSLTTIGSNAFIPKNQMGKFFLIIYTGLGIPLTLVVLRDLSYLIKQMILDLSNSLSQAFLRFLRRLFFFRFLEERINTSRYSSTTPKELNLIQLILTLLIYLLVGAYFFSSKSFLESFYLIFTTLFTIHCHTQIYQNQHFFVMIIYVFVGLGIVLLCIEAVKTQLEIFLENVGKRLLKNLLELTHQMGFHDLSPDDLLSESDGNSSPGPDTLSFSSRQRSRTASIDQHATLRPPGLTEPLRRLSSGFIRAFKVNDPEDGKRADKNVQVSTIIRRCGRCAETSLPIRPMRRHNAISSSSSSLTDYNSNCEDDDVIDFPPPTLDRIRQRRATLVAKTIINQLSTQPRSSIDELLPPYLSPNKQRTRSMDVSPVSPKCAIQISPSSRSQSPHEEEFSKIAKKISSLLTPTDDENE